VDVSEQLISLLSDFVLAADRNKVAQVIRNLTSNALKFTPADGYVTITLDAITSSATTRSSPNNRVQPYEIAYESSMLTTLQMKVMDSGAGISEVRAGYVYLVSELVTRLLVVFLINIVSMLIAV
jgi:signal transduction histidine kinase